MDTRDAGRLGGKAGRGAAKARPLSSERAREIRAKRPMRAQLVVDAVTVCCPACGEPQPCHTGSEMWTPEDFSSDGGTRTCCACDQKLVIAVGAARMLRG